MSEIILSVEQMRLVADAKGPNMVRTAAGDVFGILEPMSPADQQKGRRDADPPRSSSPTIHHRSGACGAPDRQQLMGDYWVEWWNEPIDDLAQELTMHVRIEIDPHRCHGKPVVRGTRTPVSVVLGALAAGDGIDDIARDYDISPEDVRACVAFARDEIDGQSFVPLSA